jgi:2-phosphosulfolactate phosphatase
MKIDVFLIPVNDKELHFENSVVLMIDVLRASTTICASLFNGAKEIIPCDSMDKATQIYISLSRQSSFLGGERNGLKPNGFHAGNSPLEYTPDKIKGKTIIFTTTNGTKIFRLAKGAKYRLIGGFVNISAVADFMAKYINTGTNSIQILCAGNNGKLSYEDTICAGAYINIIHNFFPGLELSDSAHAAEDLYKLHSDETTEFLSASEHAKVLRSLGFEEDIKIALTPDIYPVVPLVDNNFIIKRFIEN